MLDANEFRDWCHTLSISTPTQKLIEQIRSSPPSRRPQSSVGNVIGMYPSLKMGCTIQFESHRNELAWIYEFETDPGVLEYYDQPPPIELSYELPSGKRHRNLYTPDFFVIRADSAGYVECKPEADLIKKAKKNPHYYQKREDSLWHHAPAEKYVEHFGLYFRVYTDTEICWIRQRNFRWLEDYFNLDDPFVSTEIEDLIHDLVKQATGLTLADLILSTQSKATADDIYTLIAAGRLYVDLDAVELASPGKVRVFNDPEAAFAFEHIHRVGKSVSPTSIEAAQIMVGALVRWDGEPWRISNLGKAETTLTQDSGEYSCLSNKVFEELLQAGTITACIQENISQNALQAEIQAINRQASEKDLAEANRRYRLIEPFIQNSSSSSPSRSIRRWVKQYRDAEIVLGNGYLGLIPKPRSGNRDRRLSELTLDIMGEFIETHYETPKNRSAISVYREFRRACKNHEMSISPPSYKTFCREIKRRSGYRQTFKRQGRRVAIQKETFYWQLEMTTPRHGDRPFEVAHIDHTELDIELQASLQSISQCVVNIFDDNADYKLGRPWATMMLDAYSRRILAVYISFEPPSYRSCMMVIRICVQRYQRFPQTIVTDNGAEFHSHYYERLLAYNMCTKKSRPPAKSRFSGVIERLFGVANKQFIYELQGNTQLTHNRRQVTKTVNPKNHVTWTLGQFYEAFCRWSYEIYDCATHSTLGCSPKEAFEYGIAIGGERIHKRIEYDENFKMMTLPSPKGNTRKVQPSRGISINEWYWSESFCDPEVEGTKVEVRYDPFDLSVAYAFVKGRWEQCIAQNYQYLKGHTEKEKQLFSAEIKKRKQSNSQNIFNASRELHEFLESVRAQEKRIIKTRLQSLESAMVIQAIEKSPSQPKFLDPQLDIVQSKRRIGQCSSDEEAHLSKESSIDVTLEEEFKIYGRF